MDQNVALDVGGRLDAPRFNKELAAFAAEAVGRVDNQAQRLEL